MSQLKIQGAFVCSVALLAAMLGDAVVEGTSNAGILWHGRYTDHCTFDLLPIFLLAVAAAIVTLQLSVRQLIGELGVSMRAVLLSASRSLVPRRILRLLPAIFVLQILILFCMETLEQVVVYRHDFGGTLWLGGPIAASLFIHAVLTVVCAWLIANVVRALTTALVACIVTLFVFHSRTRWAFAHVLGAVCPRLQLFSAASTGERGPPFAIAIR